MAPPIEKRDDGAPALSADGRQGRTLVVAALFAGLVALISYPTIF